MSVWKSIKVPLDEKIIKSIKMGDQLLISGIIYTARDKAHERLINLMDQDKELPFDPQGQIIYYTGPTPKPEGKIIGSAGPTTSYRMDPFSKKILHSGIKGLIGKGKRDKQTRQLLQEYKAVYFSTYGGAGAYLNKKIVSAEVIAFDDLGPEAVFKLEVNEFPVIVINDIFGGDLYESSIKFRK